MKKNYLFNDYTFFTEMSELAVKHNSFDLSLGLPDFEIDTRLKDFLQEAAQKSNHSYESLAGNSLLIDNLIKYNARRAHPVTVKPEEISIVPCATFALYTSLKSILNFGDEVIVIQPSYYTYAPAIALNGGVPVFYDPEDDFSVDWEKFQYCISEKTKAVIINSPQNPTGKIWSKRDWDSLYHIIKDREIYLISEEIYDIYCFDGENHYSAYLHSELKKRTFSIFSFGKMFHATGWKVSYMIADPELLSNFRFYQQYISFSSNAPCQYAIAKYLEVFEPDKNRDMMQQKKDLFVSQIRDTPLVIEQPSKGSFFQVVNFRAVSKTMTDVEFAQWLTVEKKVSCLPLSAFYHSKQNSDYIRFSFAKSDSLIYDATEHLKKNL